MILHYLTTQQSILFVVSLMLLKYCTQIECNEILNNSSTVGSKVNNTKVLHPDDFDALNKMDGNVTLKERNSRSVRECKDMFQNDNFDAHGCPGGSEPAHLVTQVQYKMYRTNFVEEDAVQYCSTDRNDLLCRMDYFGNGYDQIYVDPSSSSLSGVFKLYHVYSSPGFNIANGSRVNIMHVGAGDYIDSDYPLSIELTDTNYGTFEIHKVDKFSYKVGPGQPNPSYLRSGDAFYLVSNFRGLDHYLMCDKTDNVIGLGYDLCVLAPLCSGSPSLYTFLGTGGNMICT